MADDYPPDELAERRADKRSLRDRLIDAAIRLAKSTDPWNDVVMCYLGDYVAAGLGGERCKIPVARPLVGSADIFSRFTHPLSRERLDEIADEARTTAHIVWLVPDPECPPGRLYTGLRPRE